MNFLLYNGDIKTSKSRLCCPQSSSQFDDDLYLYMSVGRRDNAPP